MNVTNPLAMSEQRGAQTTLRVLQGLGLLRLDYAGQAVLPGTLSVPMEQFNRAMNDAMPSWSL